jgi:protein-ribulosamine 3-kinase
MVNQFVVEWLKDNDYGAISSTRPVGGGCINNGARLQTTSGTSFFLKTNAHPPADMFEREAEGLEALRQPGGPRVPQPYLYGKNFLLIEDLSPGTRQSEYWPEFGRRLASLHKVVAEQYGFPHDNYIGSTPQPNPITRDGYIFFGQHRLLFQARLARDRGLLSSAEVQDVEVFIIKLSDLVPPQPPSLLHGDLWSGNAMADSNGSPAIIDPAVHYGWAEAELAMTTLFGSFPDVFYRSYEEARPLEKGYRSRFPIYNLYHLLNHLNLFGRGYYGQVISILRSYR